MLLLFTVVFVAAILCIIRPRKTVADCQATISPESIVSLLCRKGICSSVKEQWIIFSHKDKEYAINTSKLPILVVIKQTSLEGYQKYTDDIEDVAHTISLDMPMSSIHIDGNPARRVIFQVNAVENCITAFVQRLIIYIDILDETEMLFFKEVSARNHMDRRLPIRKIDIKV